MFGLTLQLHVPKGIPATYKDTHTHSNHTYTLGRKYKLTHITYLSVAKED